MASAKGQPQQLQRIAFSTSRELDFLSRKELVAQTGHQAGEWPLVALKELLDNALDACEEGGIAPEIAVAVDEKGIRVSDNGPGIPPEVVGSVLDFSIRVSSREAYVAPDRGRQGNALKTLVAMPFALSGEAGQVRIEAQGVRHDITLDVDRIRQRPVINHGKGASKRLRGTSVFIAWPDSPRSIVASENGRFLQNGKNAASDDDSPGSIDARGNGRFLQIRHCDDDLDENSPWSQEDDEEGEFVQIGPSRADSPRSILTSAKSRFLQIAADYTWLNPHLSLRVDWHGEKVRFRRTQPKWAKWKPSDPTDPHWYGVEELERLIAAYIVHDEGEGRSRTLREFLTGFRGLAGTAKTKRVLQSLKLTGAKLSDLAGEEIDKRQVERLLEAMKQQTRPVKPEALGVIGQEHLARCCQAAGAEMETFRYKRVLAAKDGPPWVLEAAFAWCPAATERRIVTGVNWSPGILSPFRQLGAGGKSLDTVLEEQRAGPEEPTILFLHVACPRVSYADRGKSSVIVED